MRRLIALLVLGLCAAAAHAAVVGRDVTYQTADTVMRGYIAYDDAIEGKRPGVLVVHEWWGHNEYARKRARMLAELGYTALAVDMYGDGKTADHPDDAGKFSAAVNSNLPERRARFLAAKELLQADPTVDPSRIAAIGYCFGGGVVLAMAREGVDLAGVVSFHGSLPAKAPAAPGAVKAKVLVLTGADDPFSPPKVVEAFKQEMDHAGADYRVVVYPGAKHSFTNPDSTALGKEFNLPLEYNAAADRASWAEMKQFLQGLFAH